MDCRVYWLKERERESSKKNWSNERYALQDRETLLFLSQDKVHSAPVITRYSLTRHQIIKALKWQDTYLALVGELRDLALFVSILENKDCSIAVPLTLYLRYLEYLWVEVDLETAWCRSMAQSLVPGDGEYSTHRPWWHDPQLCGTMKVMLVHMHFLESLIVLFCLADEISQLKSVLLSA